MSRTAINIRDMPKSVGDAIRAILKKRELLKDLPRSSKHTKGNNIHPIERVKIKAPYSKIIETPKIEADPWPS